MKELLSQKKVPFNDKNVREDAGALNELRKMGYNSVPVTIIDGQRIHGFDKATIEKALTAA
ncbi:MAG: glutaredoxin family protein [Candidatus Methylomirabilales bacterium]